MPIASSQLPTGAVTFLFTDIEGSTRLWESHADSMPTALAEHDQIVNKSIASNGGMVFKTGGDSFCSSFHSPRQALDAAIACQLELETHRWATEDPIRVRMAIHTGTAQLRDNDYFGPTLNRVSRVMSLGRGGQILVSSSSQQLLMDDLPEGTDLPLMGTQHLKGLDRPEVVFQVRTPGLFEYPPFEAEPSTDSDVAAAAKAYKAKDWQQVVDLLLHLETTTDLTGDQHEMVGYALWWLGQHDTLLQRLERTYATYLSEGNADSAAKIALHLADNLSHNLASDVASVWVRRAEQLLNGRGDSPSMGYLIRWRAVEAFNNGDVEKAISMTHQMEAIAKDLADGALEVLALQDRGRYLISSGNLDEGMPLMDEAMIGAVAGDVDPITVGRSYCNMLAVCDLTGDVRRAAEWSAAANRWCEESESSPYPGVCRIYKAEILWHNGRWREAEEEVKRATDAVGLYTDVSGEAWYQYGEMRLRVGDWQGAEVAFQEALNRGREPLPGYALLLAHMGDLDDALELLDQALSLPSITRLDRARFLPVMAELQVLSGDIAEATTAVNELVDVAELADSDLFRAQAARSRGLIAIAEGKNQEGITEFQAAIRLFTGLGLPIDSARVRIELGRVHLENHSTAMAKMELKSARRDLERIGLGADVDVIDQLLAD